MSIGIPTSKDHGSPSNSPTTASITINAGDLVLIFCNNNKAIGKGAPSAGSVTGGTGGFTSSGWTTQVDQASIRGRLTVLSQRFSAGITGTISLQLGTVPGTGTYEVVVVSGTDATTPIPHTAAATNTGTNASVSLAAPPATGNIVIAAFSTFSGTSTFSAGSGFTAITSQAAMFTEYQASNVQTATVVNVLDVWCGGVLEIGAAGGGGSPSTGAVVLNCLESDPALLDATP